MRLQDLSGVHQGVQRKSTPLLFDFKATKVEYIKDLSSYPSSLVYYDKGEKMVKQGVLQSPCGKHKSTQAVSIHSSPHKLCLFP